MKHYTFPGDLTTPPDLPHLVRGTEGLLAVPDREKLLLAVRAPFRRTVCVVGDGISRADGAINIPVGHYHVILDRTHFVVDPRDVVAGAIEDSKAAYQIAGLPPNPTDPAHIEFNKIWHGEDITPITLRRIDFAHVVGQIARGDAPRGEEGWIYVGPEGRTRYRAIPGTWLIHDNAGRNFRATTAVELNLLFPKPDGEAVWGMP